MRKLSIVFLVILVSCIPRNEAPDCNFVTPEDGSEYARGENIEVYIEASDEDGDIAEVRLYLDGLGISSITPFPYSFTLETTELEVGTHSLEAEVVDDLGEESEIDVSFVITTGLPIVETLQPVSVSVDDVIVGGTIIDDGGGTISEAGILWGYEPYDLAGNNERNAEVSNSIFTITLMNMAYSTIYVTAFAENEKGRSFGEELVFTALPLPDLALN